MNLRSLKLKKKFLVVCSIKRQIRKFHVVVVQWTSKKCTEKRDTRAELLFWSLIKPIVFWSRRCGCRRRRSCLSSLMSTINDILAAVSLQTALSPGPFNFPWYLRSYWTHGRLIYCAAIICSSVVMQNMASSPFYLLLVVSTNFLSSNAKPVSLLDNGE